MNEYFVVFETPEHAERSGLMPGYTTPVQNMHVVRLRIPFLPWGLTRECVAYTQFVGSACVRTSCTEADYSSEFLQGILEQAVAYNLAPIQINQW